MNYLNPVIPGFHPDPSWCRVGDDYYLVTSTFEYFPGVPVFHSRDLVHWRKIGHCLTRDSQLPLRGKKASEGIYAPTLRYHNGRFYMITTLIPEVLNFFVHTTDPAGEWSEPVIVDQPGIDPSLLFDDDGRVYCTSQGPGGVIQSEIDIETGRRLSLWQPIWEGSGQISPEGPHLYRIGDHYYVLVAEGGTHYGHMETVARADNPWGPFTPCPHNPVLFHFNARAGSSPIRGTGHADLLQAADGTWWLVFLAFRPMDGQYQHLGRETFLAPVTWRDGWPVVNGNGVVRLDMELDIAGPPSRPWLPPSTRDHFDSDVLGLDWNFIRNPDPEGWSLCERSGFLRLRSNGVGLDDPTGSPAFIGRRQQHFQCRAAALLDFQSSGDGDEAGLTALMNDRHHYEIAIRQTNGEREVILRRRIGDLQTITATAPCPDGPVLLKLISDNRTYRFLYGPEKGALTELGTGACRYLSSEVAGGYTGVYLGLYCMSGEAGRTCHADFDYFDYSEYYE